VASVVTEDDTMPKTIRTGPLAPLELAADATLSEIEDNERALNAAAAAKALIPGTPQNVIVVEKQINNPRHFTPQGLSAFRADVIEGPYLKQLVDFAMGEGCDLCDGDTAVTLVVRELYKDAMRAEAAAQHKNLRDYMQGLLDWWVEQEYASLQGRSA
jgi:hypothetical protein